jgi:mRNA interferase RelE/StbE
MWRVRYTRSFLKDLSGLPRRERERVEQIAFGEAIRQDPLLGGKVQKLVGYQEHFKLRIGVYRVGLKIDFDERIIEFRRVLHRKDIYREFP